MSFNLSTLTSPELESVLEAFDALAGALELLERQHAIKPNDEYDMDELADAIVEEMTTRGMEDAGYKVNSMVARGELDRYVRPDGQIGYAAPGMMDEVQS